MPAGRLAEEHPPRAVAGEQQGDDDGDGDEERLLGPLGPDQPGAEQNADGQHQPPDEQPGQQGALVGQGAAADPAAIRHRLSTGLGDVHGGLAEDRKADLSLQSIWHGTSTSPAAATAPCTPGSPPIRPGGRRPTTPAGAPPTPGRAGRSGWCTVEPAADRGAALRRELAIKRLPRPEKERLVTRSIVHPAPGPPSSAASGRRRWRSSAAWRGTTAANGSSGTAPIYETEVRDPLRALVEEMDVRLARVAPEMVGDPRRSIFRIHRDVRFSADKSPYKTNAACQFYHRDAGRGAGQDAEGAGAGLYFQLADGECFVAGGIWMPARPGAREDPRGAGGGPRGAGRDRPRARRSAAGSRPSTGRRCSRGSRGATPRATRPSGGSGTSRSRPPGCSPSARSTSAAARRRLLERDFAALVPLVRWLNGAIGYRAWERRY